MAQAAEAAGPCTILVNNAGIVTGKKLLDGSDSLQELTMAVNATAHSFGVVRAKHSRSPARAVSEPS